MLNGNGFLALKKYKDDMASLTIFNSFYDCRLKEKLGNWEIEWIPDNNFIEENNYPDWYGYKKNRS